MTWPLPRTCRALVVVTCLSASTRAIVALTETAAFRPEFFSNFGEPVDSISCVTERTAIDRS